MASELSTEHLIRPNECAQGGLEPPRLAALDP